MLLRRSLAVLLLALISLALSAKDEAKDKPPKKQYKILVYSSKFGHSHCNFVGNIADVLVEAGHDVTTLLPEVNEQMADGTTKSKKIHMYKEMMGSQMDFFETSNYDVVAAIMQGRFFGNLFVATCKTTINTPGLMEKLRDEHYDVLITETFDLCGAGIADFVKPKSLIVLSTSVLVAHQHDEIGVMQSLSHNPSLFTTKLDVHSMVDRFWNLFAEGLLRIQFGSVRPMTDVVLKERFGKDYPNIMKITGNSAYVFTNGEPLIGFAAPTLSKVIDIAGIGAKEPKALDKFWLEILGRRERTVLISFGSVTQSRLLKASSKDAILKTVAAFPDITFVWKYEEPEDDFGKNKAAALENLVLTKWMPQNDLLNHSKVVAFISHGGMGSVQETARRGTPAIFLPLFGDQPRNAYMMEQNGLGKMLDKRHISNAPVIIATLKEVLEDKSFTKRCQRMSRMLARKPFNAKELLVKHVEFAAEFGPSASLRPESLDMNIIELYNLDIIAILLVICIAVTAISLYAVKLAVSRIFKLGAPKQKTSIMMLLPFVLALVAILVVPILSTDEGQPRKRKYKILVYNAKFGHSHTNFMGNIADVLVEAGHDVTSLLPQINPLMADGTTLSKKIHVSVDNSTVQTFADFLNAEFDYFDLTNFNIIGAIMQRFFFASVFPSACRSSINTPGLMEKLKAEQFDLVIAETFDVCGMGFSHYIQPNATILISSMDIVGVQHDEIGVVQALSHNPSTFAASLNVHSIADRFWNLYAEWMIRLAMGAIRPLTDAMLKERFGADYPDVMEIASHAAFAFTNVDPLLGFATPTLSKVIDIAGIAVKEPKPLDKFWLEIVERRERTVLISFGSLAQSRNLKPAAKDALLETIAAFPDVTFIWKYEDPKDEFGKGQAASHDNLVLAKWMPQNDLLTFVTHAGMGSVQETARSGTPGIFIPLLGDQTRNALMMKERGLGKLVDKRHIYDSSVLIAALKEVLGDESLHQRCKRMAQVLARKPFHAKELLMKHVEFAAEFGPFESLRPASFGMSTVELYNLDILLIAFIATVIVFSVTLYTAKRELGKVIKIVTVKEKTS